MSRAKTRKKNLWNQRTTYVALGLIIFIGLTESEEGRRLLSWIFIILLITGLAYGYYYFFIRKKNFTHIVDLYEVDKMDGYDFERYLVPLFTCIGYNVVVTKGSGDYGADLILKKKRKKYVVQAKRYSSSIGVAAIQQVVGAIRYYKADGAMVVTNQYFTPAAEELAKHNRVKLIDRDELTYMIKTYKSRYDK
ncbi:hypothetical protein B5V89_14565 [Heyndrickxia sporothermodurans]|uniref:restriction endonuclease n=1 Tax=Heyndrickxia TaxID=2837504 RepID=UPI000D380DDE|nr:restriction endonuclease [Heyndrickxia sporothermodurans]PTY77436.1 hypothetical protein B5V89_14565 [Heyndrickxia sporothermodurans]